MGTMGQASESLMAPCELQEEVLVQFFPAGPLPRGQENVAPDVLVHDAAAGGHTAESHVDVLIELDGHLRREQPGGPVGVGIRSRPGPAPASPGHAPTRPGHAPTGPPGPPAGCPS